MSTCKLCCNKARAEWPVGAARRTRNAMVIAELALAAALLGGAGLLVNSFLRLQSVNPGFDAK